MEKSTKKPLVGVIMGSQSDWPTMEIATIMLDELGVPHEVRIISAHRTPYRAFSYAAGAASRGLRCIIAGAGGAAHLAGIVAGVAWPVPVLGVPMESQSLKGMDSLLSTVQMPGGVPVATFAIGTAGAKNAALFAALMLAGSDTSLLERLVCWHQQQVASIPETPFEKK